MALFFLELARCGTGIENLSHTFAELFKLEWPVVPGARQAEAVLDQRILAALVTGVHAADLGDRHVRLVNDRQEVRTAIRLFRKIIKQSIRRLAGQFA